ncbi:ergothioneine biosynthesis protein EgtB [Catalinimonas alkaloidigena]|uniref:Ergothioneine biosynthesis protein EgtB n=1 Tax=Catalinimonas alkaloidigena TaxID=1075417 RepID=A0A1G9B1N8_9BACT|nr:ergothioneine biosynthesis protein EgtB [Catalinimonas alkaloidigena]SDK33452.1 ergothioneine biosynthesis protein EgtB [Catalinimonas alkaloidigena]
MASPVLTSVSEKRNLQYLARFTQVRSFTESICRPLTPEDHVVQPMADVSPPKWHMAHTTWFFETFLLNAYDPNYQLFHPDYSYLFNSYYESVGKRVLRAHRGNMTRPPVEDILRYRTHVNAAMQALLDREEAWPERFYYILEVGLQHEQQHQELLFTDLKYILGNNPLFPAYREDVADLPAATPRPSGYLTVDEGVYPIGFAGEGFCFDNELGRHQVYLHACRLQDRLVTNGEYLEFIEAGGYQNFRYWLAEGWDWVKTHQATAPLYWHQIEGEWHYYTLGGLKKVDLHSPVTHVNYYEADAYARFRGKRLPTEFEWEVACQQQGKLPDAANLGDREIWHPAPAAEGQPQLYGDVWEWTSSAYLPYPYYQHEDGALGEYNGKFMISQMVLRGGSCITPRDHIRPTYRNFFHPDKQWQFTGIRLAETV